MALCAAMCKRACVIVVPCMLAPGVQAEANCNTFNWGNPFIKTALHNDIDIHVLPCTESLFNGLGAGLTRKKHGIDYYNSIPEYKDFCIKKAHASAEMIQELMNRYSIIAVIGVEHSPSCAINYMYSHHGMLKESGLFMRSLRGCLLDKSISIPFIGVNRKYPRKSLTEFEALILKEVNERERKKNDDNI